ncbi:MAG: hypothetical protein QOJ86_4216, partial [Bradyrhizobium sp.]|nr:hypothetical protein [Bradyrhizobium sp.]
FDEAANHVAIGDVLGGIEGVIGQSDVRRLVR